MDPEQLKAFMDALEALRADITKSISAVDAKCDALAEDVKTTRKSDTAGERDRGVDTSMRRDNDDRDPAGEERHEARQTAADRARSDSADITATQIGLLLNEVKSMKNAMAVPATTRDQMADAQAKADAVMRLHGESAEMPMAGEDLVPYQIRLARKMQPHSKKWKGVTLQALAGDRTALNNILEEIRADATEAGLNPVGLPEFQHRKIVKQSPGGHTITEFVGNGTVFKQLSRPVRHVGFIGTRTGAWQ